MTTQIQCLMDYKYSIISVSGKNIKLKRYLTKAFTRWMFNAPKNGILPTESIVNLEEITFANIHNKYNLDIKKCREIWDNAFNKLQQCFKHGSTHYTTYNHKLITQQQKNRLVYLHKLAESHSESKHTQEHNKEPIRIKVDASNLNSEIAEIVNLYYLIGMDNQHLSVPPIFKGVEMFGTPLNTHNDDFCSPFEIDKKFNSLGSFWNYQFHKDGIYLCNPPYDDILMKNVALKIEQDLLNTTHKVAVLIVLPVWDKATQKKLNIPEIPEYETDFEAYHLLLASKFIKSAKVLDQHMYKYYSYYEHRKFPACFTHFIYLSNGFELDFEEYVLNWKKWSSSSHIVID